MRKRVCVNLTMVVLVAGLFFTVSCAKKAVVSTPAETQVENAQPSGAQNGLSAEAIAKQEAAKQAQLAKEAEIKEKALREAAARKKAEAMERFVNQDVHFAFDSAQLTPTAQTILKEKAGWLEDNMSVNIRIEGNCDERGTTEYNLALGERRALSVKNFFVDLGISGSRLTTISYGEERPLDPAHNEAAWAKNRRVHCTIK